MGSGGTAPRSCRPPRSSSRYPTARICSRSASRLRIARALRQAAVCSPRLRSWLKSGKTSEVTSSGRVRRAPRGRPAPRSSEPARGGDVADPTQARGDHDEALEHGVVELQPGRRARADGRSIAADWTSLNSGARPRLAGARTAAPAAPRARPAVSRAACSLLVRVTITSAGLARCRRPRATAVSPVNSVRKALRRRRPAAVARRRGGAGGRGRRLQKPIVAGRCEHDRRRARSSPAGVDHERRARAAGRLARVGANGCRRWCRSPQCADRARCGCGPRAPEPAARRRDRGARAAPAGESSAPSAPRRPDRRARARRSTPAADA